MKYCYLASMILLSFTGCVGASTFGLSEDVYRRTLASLKNKQLSLKVTKINFRGSPEEIGKQKAALLSLQPALARVLHDTLSFSRIQLGEPEITRNTMRRYFPDLYRELLTFAGNSAYSEDEVFSFAGSHFAIGGCTILIRSGDHPLLARNYDWSPTLTDGILASHEGLNHRIASLSMTASVFGALSGINEKGLAIAITGINSKKNYSNLAGLSMPIIVRGVLETAVNVQSAIDILMRVPHTTPAGYALADKSGNIAVVEVSPPRVVVRENHSSRGFLIATNHFQKLSNDAEGVHVMPNSERRNKVVAHFQSRKPDAPYRDVLSFMGRVRQGPAMDNYSMMLGTLWTIIYLPQTQEMVIRVGLEGKPTKVGFSQLAPITISGTMKDRPPDISDFF